jgi:LysR family hydrogen peroxide-inducible transcriptional activator
MPLVIEENMTANLADLLRDNDIDVAILSPCRSICPAC